MKYYEIEFGNEPRCSEWNESCTGDYSICILAKREPSIEEAAEFCRSDMEQMGYKFVVGVTEIDKEEARMFFDMSKEKDFPIFQ